MRTKERIKTVLICVLIVGTLYLTYATWFFDSPFRDISFFGSDSAISGEMSLLSDKTDLEAFGIRPMAISVLGNGERKGAVYNSEETDRLYKALRDQMSIAFSSAAHSGEVSEERWQAALSKKGAFFDYFGEVPLGVIALWLDAENQSFGAESGRYILLSAEERNVSIYLKNGETQRVSRFETKLSSERLLSSINEISASRAELALEKSGEAFGSILPETVVPEERAKPAVITSFNPLSLMTEDSAETLVDVFNMGESNPNMYTEQNGALVYVADLVTLKISSDGTVTYSDSREKADELLGLEIKSARQTPTRAEQIEGARELAARLAGMRESTGGLYVIEVSSGGDETTAVFGWQVNGIPADMKETAYFVKAVVKGKTIKRVTANLCGFEQSGATAEILREELAAAALHGAGKQGALNLRYADSGEETLAPGWYIGGVKKTEKE